MAVGLDGEADAVGLGIAGEHDAATVGNATAFTSATSASLAPPREPPASMPASAIKAAPAEAAPARVDDGLTKPSARDDWPSGRPRLTPTGSAALKFFADRTLKVKVEAEKTTEWNERVAVFHPKNIMAHALRRYVVDERGELLSEGEGPFGLHLKSDTQCCKAWCFGAILYNNFSSCMTDNARFANRAFST